MKLKINGNDVELIYSFRSAIYFEQIAGRNIDANNSSGNDLVILFYSVVIASMQKAKLPIISMLDFLDVVDENGGDKCLIDFSNWFTEIMNAQWEAYSSTMSDKEKKEIKPSKKKKKEEGLIFSEIYKNLVVIHKVCSYEYFMDEMQLIDLSIIYKFIEFNDVAQWMQTRQILYNIAWPYLKNKKMPVTEYWPLPTDEKHEKITEVSNKEVEWFKKFKESYENKESN